MSTPALKLCPFCPDGGKPVMRDFYHVRCERCGAGREIEEQPWTEEEAAALWNSRPLEDEIVGALEGLLRAYAGMASAQRDVLLSGAEFGGEHDEVWAEDRAARDRFLAAHTRARAALAKARGGEGKESNCILDTSEDNNG